MTSTCLTCLRKKKAKIGGLPKSPGGGPDALEQDHEYLTRAVSSQRLLDIWVEKRKEISK